MRGGAVGSSDVADEPDQVREQHGVAEAQERARSGAGRPRAARGRGRRTARASTSTTSSRISSSDELAARPGATAPRARRRAARGRSPRGRSRTRPRASRSASAARHLVGDVEAEPDRELAREVGLAAREHAASGGDERGHEVAQSTPAAPAGIPGGGARERSRMRRRPRSSVLPAAAAALVPLRLDLRPPGTAAPAAAPTRGRVRWPGLRDWLREAPVVALRLCAAGCTDGAARGCPRGIRGRVRRGGSGARAAGPSRGARRAREPAACARPSCVEDASGLSGGAAWSRGRAVR